MLQEEPPLRPPEASSQRTMVDVVVIRLAVELSSAGRHCTVCVEAWFVEKV